MHSSKRLIKMELLILATQNNFGFGDVEMKKSEKHFMFDLII